MSRIGIIGGSALSGIEGFSILEKKKVKTPFGEPSEEMVIGLLEGREVVFMPRHGQSHGILPSEVNNRANIYAFKLLDVNRIISVSAVGSLKEEIKPLDVVLVDQFVDRTNQARPSTFFGEGIVAHIPFDEPVCNDLKDAVYKSNKALDINIHSNGTYINMEGPAFSTKAESYLYKSWGMDVIGMTNMSEARLAREAGICYSTIAMVTDYDCWYLDSSMGSVSVDMIMENIRKNMDSARDILVNTVKALDAEPVCGCADALRNSIITDMSAVDPEKIEKLKPILGKFI